MNKLHKEMMANREDVVEACKTFVDKEGIDHGSCSRIDGQKCSAYMLPEVKWRLGVCPLATHYIDETIKTGSKVRVGQQKQSKH